MTSTGCEFQRGCDSAACVLSHTPSYLAEGSCRRRPLSPALVSQDGSRHPSRSSINIDTWRFPCRRSTGVEQSAIGHLSNIIIFLLSDNSLTGLTFVIAAFAHSFSIAAPKIWNSVPLSLCTCTSPIPSLVTSRPTTASRPIPIHFTLLLLCLRFTFCWPLCVFINYIYFLCLQCFDAVGWAAGRASGL